MATNNPFYVDPGNDFSAGLSGLSNTLANVRQGRVMQAEQDRRQRAEDEQKQRQQEASAAAQQAYQTGDPDMMAKVSLQYPEIAQNLHQIVGLNDERKVKEAAGFARDLLLSPPDQRETIFQNRIQTLQDQGRDPTHTAQAYQSYLKDPNRAMQGIELDWAAGDPNGYKVVSEKERARAKAELEQSKIDREDARFERAEAGRNQRAYARAAATANGSASEKTTAHQKDWQAYQKLKAEDPVAAKEYGMAAGFVGKEGRELSPQVQKRLSTSIDAAVQAENTIGKYDSLADQMSSADFQGGVAGGVAEKIKELTGSQDAITDLRKEAYQARASQAMANLPPGAASDPDVKIAFQPMPSDNASPKQWERWLRAQSKVQKINAGFHNFKADYMSEHGSERGMLQAWKDQGGSVSSAPEKSATQPAAAPAPAAGGWRIVP